MKRILAVVVVLCLVFVGVAMAGPPRLESQVEFQKFVIGSQQSDQTGVLSVTDVSWKEGTALSVSTAVNFNESTLISALTTMNIAATVTDQYISENQKEAAIKSREIVSACCQLQQMQSSFVEIALSAETRLTRLQNKADPFRPVFYLAQKSPPAAVLLC